MNKLNFDTIQNIKDCFLDLEVSEEASPDVIAERIVLSDCPVFNVPVKIIELNGDKHYRYIIGANISYRYINHSMSMKDFIKLLNNMTSPFLECSDWFLDYHQFYLDVDHVYVDKNDLSVKYIYIFDKNVRCEDRDIKSFFTEVINDINITDNPSIQVEFYKYLLGKDFSLLGISELIKKYESSAASKKNDSNAKQNDGAPVPAFSAASKPAEAAAVQFEKVSSSITKPSEAVNSEAAPTVRGKNYQADKKKEDENLPVFSTDDLDNDIAEMLSNMNDPDTSKKKNKSGGIFKRIFGKKNDIKSSDEKEKASDEKKETALISNDVPVASISYVSADTEIADFNSDETQIIGADQLSEASGYLASLELISSAIDNAPDRIILDLRKGYMIIGRKTHDNVKNADFEFESTIKKVSRKHLRIEHDGNEYRAVDLGSSNGTYVNDKKLVPNMAEKLSNNAEITFAQNILRYRFVIR